MGNQFDIRGCLTALLGRPNLELSAGDRKFLFQLLEGAESTSSMNRSINRKYKLDFPPDIGNDGQLSGNALYFTKGPLSKPAVRKRMKKLARHGVIEPVDKKSLTDKERFAINLRRAKPFRITEYGLFIILSQVGAYPSGLFTRFWQSKVMSVLLSPYFEKETVVHPTPELYFAITVFLHEACNITVKRLDEIVQRKEDYETRSLQKHMRKLEDDLLWHAKAFALRLLVDAAGEHIRSRAAKSRHILDYLASDKKFTRLILTVVQEVQSGSRLVAPRPQ